MLWSSEVVLFCSLGTNFRAVFILLSGVPLVRLNGFGFFIDSLIFRSPLCLILIIFILILLAFWCVCVRYGGICIS